jgi:hypothetical protein
MTRFLDGPAAGVLLMLRRAPRFLRVVKGSEGWDALDQLADAPAAGETITAYRRVGTPGAVHLLMSRGRGRTRSAWYRTAEYRAVDPQPPAEVLRETASWRAWALAEDAKGRVT